MAVVRTVTVRYSGGDYTGLQAAFSGEAQDMNALGGDLKISIEGDWSASADLVGGFFNGFSNLDATHHVIIEADATNKAGTSWSSSKYRMMSTSGGIGSAVFANNGWLEIVGLQIDNQQSSESIVIVGTDCTVRNCLIRGNNTGIYSEGANTKIINVAAVSCAARGFDLRGTSPIVYNSVAANCGAIGISSNAVVKNCYFGNNSSGDISGSPTITASRTSDGSGSTSIVTWDTSNFTAVGADSEDIALPSGSDLIDIGTDLRADAMYPFDYDILGNARGATWSIGAQEPSSTVALTAESISSTSHTGTPSIQNIYLRTDKTFGSRKLLRPFFGKGGVSYLGLTAGHGLSVDPYIIGEYIRNIPPSVVVDHLEANSIAAPPSVGTPVLGQIHALAPVPIASASFVANPAVGQTHALVASNVHSNTTVDNPAIGVVQDLTANSVASASFVGSPILSRVVALTATTIASNSHVGASSIGQIHALSANTIASVSSVGAPILGHRYAFTAAGVASVSSVGTPAPGQIHALAAVSVASPSHVGVSSLGQRHALSANSIISSPTVGAPTLSEAGTMVAVPIASATFVGTPSPTQVHSLGATSIVALSSTGIPALLVIRNLLASSIVGGSFVGNPALGQVHILVGNSIYSITTVGMPSLDVGGTPIGKILVGGVWYKIDECRILVAGSWRLVDEVRILTDGVWRTPVL